jgi:hypothetical protein
MAVVEEDLEVAKFKVCSSGGVSTRVGWSVLPAA